jgi:1,4-alpha-glucan branching enzyme
MKAVERKRVTFNVKGEPGSKIYVAGSFNDWDPSKNKLVEKKGNFSVSMLVPTGRHEYKFVVNDVWTVDPNCADWVPNGCGSLNSVVVVD